VNVLVVAPHPDDEAIGCGGSICLHAACGDRVRVAFLTSGELGLKHLPREEAWRVRESEAEAAAEVLGTSPPIFLRHADWFVSEVVSSAAATLRSILEEENPDLIYLPHALEWHPDHQAANAVVHEALRDHRGAVPALLTFEVWTPLTAFDQVEDISSVMDRKIQAIRCYASQLSHFQYDRAVFGLNQFRGSLAALSEYAEVFQFMDSTSSISVIHDPDLIKSGQRNDS
jgi:LmbE family N-acetylglucosaminyl deacetylase